MLEISSCLGLLAGLIHLSSYALYNRQMLTGASRPNTTTWLLWTFLAGLNAASYLIMSADWAKSVTPIAGAAACAVTLTLAASKGKLSRLSRFDGVILAIGSTAGLIWWVSRDAAWANLLLQVAFLISNIPTFRGVWRDPLTEKPLAWFGFGLAYIISLIVVVLRWQGQWIDLAYPLCSLLADGGVGAVCVLRRWQRGLKLF
ncbi:MAG: hypothetical protein WCT10_00235 [Patescibacteria group bacterium]